MPVRAAPLLLAGVLLAGCGAPAPIADPPAPPVDEPSAPTTPADGDGDGFAGADDCDDADATRYPDAPDAPYDGVDSDCRGDSDFDIDGDGSKVLAYGGSDCDDWNAGVHVGAPRVCGNGVDDDCDGEQDCLFGELALDDVADGRLTAGADSWVEAVEPGDVNGDGATDIVLGGGFGGATVVFEGPLLGVRDAAEAVLPPSAGGMDFGDFDGDGLDDVVVTHHGFDLPAATVIRAGPDLGGEVATLLHADGSGEAGRTHAADVNGDGFDDVVLGAVRGCDLEGHEGVDGDCVAILHGPFAGDILPSDVDTVLVGEGVGASPGIELDGGSDLDGDGLADLVLVDGSAGLLGTVYVVPTPAGTWHLADAHTRLAQDPGLGASAGIRAARAGDVDGDGQADLLVGTSGDAARPGAAWVLLGPVDGALDPAAAFATLSGVNVQDAALPGDVDGDGQADVVLLTRYRDPATDAYVNRPEIFYAPAGAATAGAILHPTLAGVAYSHARGLGDVDGDDLADFVVSGRGVTDASGTAVGGAVVVLGETGL